MSTLMSAYTSDVRLQREEIANLPLPASKGRFHQPVSFIDYIECVSHEMERQGVQILSEEHLIGHEGERYFGLMEVAPIEGEYISADDWKLLVGLRGSHDQSIPRSLAVGRQVMVCSNLCFHGDLATLQTKQTLNVWERLPQMINTAIAKIPEKAKREQQRVDGLKLFNFPQRSGDAALVELMRRGALTGSQVGRAAQEWIDPSHDEFTEDGFNLWRLEQAVTEAIKPTGSTSNIFTTSQRTELASEFLNEVMGF